jgi:hypothetical protein
MWASFKAGWSFFCEKTFRYFILNFSISAFGALIDFLLVDLFWFNRNFSYSTYLRTPAIMFHYLGFPRWNYWMGGIFLLLGLGKYLGTIFRLYILLRFVSAFSFAAWMALSGLFYWYYVIYGLFPVAEIHFSVVLAYANVMLFLRYSIGYVRIQGREDEKGVIY